MICIDNLLFIIYFHNEYNIKGNPVKTVHEGYVESAGNITFCLYTLFPDACEDEATFPLSYYIEPSLRTGRLT